MAKKLRTPKFVTLKRNKNGANHKFEFAHALNLLRLQARTGGKGWELADDNYEFKDNEICKRPSSGENQETD